MDKTFKYSISIGIIIVALSVAYYLVIFLPKKEAGRLEQQRQEQEANERNNKIKEEELRRQEENERAIRKGCAEWALIKATGKEKFEQGAHYNQGDYDDYYARCLREKGL